MAQDSVQRLVGIDFGTSTSLIRVKRYRSGQPVGDSHHTGSVTYGNGAGDSKAVTLVRLNADRSFTCGRYGEEETPGSTVYREFKMDLEHPDPQTQGLAKELTGEYFRYLYSRYDHQQSDLGQSGDQVRTIISYPAKWKRETVAFMEEVASDAGFPNVTSMDEPSAALYAVLCRKMDEITSQGILTPGHSGYVLLIDMGAGTTDLALCRYAIADSEAEHTAAEQIQTGIVSTYPPDSSSLTFGGREVDRILEDYLIRYLCSCGYTPAMAENVIRGKPNVKTWKEDTVSVLLAHNQPVNTCTLARQYAMIFGQDTPFPSFDRVAFQQMLSTKLDDFCSLVHGCLDDALEKEPALTEKGIDLVVLTGGHSSWYFTSELLDGTLPGISHPLLEKIRSEKHRVLRLSNPQETVALGMVYSSLPFRVDKPVPPEPAPEDEPIAPDPISAQRMASHPPVRANPHAESLQAFFTASGFRSLQLVPPEKLAVLRASLQVPSHAVTYRGYDSSFFSTAKSGTLFTDLGIYSRSSWGNPAFCSWEDLAQGFLRIGNGVILLHNETTHTEVAAGAFSGIGEDVLIFYRQLQALVSKPTEAPGAEPASQTAPDYAGVNFEAIMNQTLLRCNPAMLATLTGKSVPALMRPHLSVPPHESVYFSHDDTWFHTGKNGTVFTGSGIYSRSLGNPAIYTPWAEFAQGSISAENGTIFLRSPDGSRKQEVGYFTLCISGAIGLYLELQKAFRESALAPAPAAQEEAAPSPVEDFLNLLDCSALQYLFPPSSLLPVRAEAEPVVGKLLLVHRDFDETTPGRPWFWFALGHNGICNHFRQFLPWSDFVTAPIIFDRKTNAEFSPETHSGFYPTSPSTCCKIGETFIPCKDGDTTLRLCLFFRQLQTYLRDPAAYTVPSCTLREDLADSLAAFSLTSPASGIFTPSVLEEPMLRDFLALPEASVPLYHFHSGNLHSLVANACVIDRFGLRSRNCQANPVCFTPFATFAVNPLWCAGQEKRWNFYAGSQYLFSATGSADWMETTLAFLKSLQKLLTSEK